jgi:RHS repeat-associated protein
VVWEATYAPFGEATLKPDLDPVLENHLRFPGQHYDSETGFHYNGFRDYHPGIGRYLQADPIGLKGGMNVFAYALNNPVNWTDPSGQAVPLGIAIARVAIGAAAGAAGGWVAGKMQGNTFSAVVGGIVGGVVGGAVGLVSPQTSNTVGGMIGGAIAGAIGGAAGGVIGGAIDINQSEPDASITDWAWSIGLGASKGIAVGTMAGGITGGIGTAAVVGGASLWAADLAGVMTAEPIAIGLGLVPFPWWDSDGTGERISSSVPPSDPNILAQVTAEEFGFQLPPNDLPLYNNRCVTLSVVGGTPPYRWFVEPAEKFFFAKTETNGLSNTLCAAIDACEPATVRVFDNQNSLILGETTAQWVHLQDYHCVQGEMQPCTGTCVETEIGLEAPSYVGKYMYLPGLVFWNACPLSASPFELLCYDNVPPFEEIVPCSESVPDLWDYLYLSGYSMYECQLGQ